MIKRILTSLGRILFLYTVSMEETADSAVCEDMRMKRITAGSVLVLAAFLAVCLLCTQVWKTAACEPVLAAEQKEAGALAPADAYLSADSLLPQASAASLQDGVDDGAGLFTDDEIRKMQELIARIREKYGLDTFVVTWDAMEDPSAQLGYSDNYARDLLHQVGEEAFPQGYLAFGIHMNDRSFWVDAYGQRAVDQFPVSVTEDMAEDAQDDLSDGEYGMAAIHVLEEAEKKLEISSSPLGFLKKPLLYPGQAAVTGGLALVIAACASLFVTMARSNKHKDKNVKLTAEEYGRNFSLTSSRDVFMRHYQTRVPRPKENHSSGGGGISSGGGGGHSGSGGHF